MGVRRATSGPDTPQSLTPNPTTPTKSGPSTRERPLYQGNCSASQSHSHPLPAEAIMVAIPVPIPIAIPIPIPAAIPIPVEIPIPAVPEIVPVVKAAPITVSAKRPAAGHPIATVIVASRPEVPRSRAGRNVVALVHAHINSKLSSLCRNASQACCACQNHRSQHPTLHAAHNPSVLAGIRLANLLVRRRPSSFPVSGLSLAASPVTPVMSCANTPRPKGCGPHRKIISRNFLQNLC